MLPFYETGFQNSNLLRSLLFQYFLEGLEHNGDKVTISKGNPKISDVTQALLPIENESRRTPQEQSWGMFVQRINPSPANAFLTLQDLGKKNKGRFPSSFPVSVSRRLTPSGDGPHPIPYRTLDPENPTPHLLPENGHIQCVALPQPKRPLHMIPLLTLAR